MTDKDKIARLKAELEALDSVTEEQFEAEEDRKDHERDDYITTMALRSATDDPTRKHKSGVARSRALGIPSSAIPNCPSTNQYHEPCRLKAGYGTDHFGEGLCKYHGGNLQTGQALRPHNRSRYAGLMTKEIGASVDHFLEDKDPLNLEQDIAVVRALTEKWIADYDTWFSMMVAWWDDHEAGNIGKPKPRKLLELGDAHRLLDTLTKMAGTEYKRRQNTAVTQLQMISILNSIGEIIARHVPDEKVQQEIRKEFLKLRIPVTISEQYHGL